MLGRATGRDVNKAPATFAGLNSLFLNSSLSPLFGRASTRPLFKGAKVSGRNTEMTLRYGRPAVNDKLLR